MSEPIARRTGSMDGKVLECFRVQVEACHRLGSPFTGMLCDLLAERLDRTTEFGRRILDWPGSPGNDVLALRATGGLHALARSGRLPLLTAAYPPHPVEREDLWRAVDAAVNEEDAFLCGYLDGPPQTNEVARSGVILGGCLLISAATRQPLTIFEIGASAGLNLGFDRYRYDLGGESWGDEASPVRIRCEWSGEPPAIDTPLQSRCAGRLRSAAAQARLGAGSRAASLLHMAGPA